MKLVWSSKFTRSAKKLARHKPELLDALEAALRRLEKEPFDSKLRTHKLSGDFEGCWACSASYDLRIVFEFVRVTPEIPVAAGCGDAICQEKERAGNQAGACGALRT